ncbi:DNA primase [Sulfobacillus thermosulfidooxidans]|uniref:DNA primase n=1 Tax=Sulfobacillus thermosulfidooxidans TaxID=28034 RepID=UPI000414B036|nr:DNA primase [Sulfobacillus thermosulfidooxidans]
MLDSTYEAWVNAVRDAADIVDVIGRYVSLKQKGKNFWGLCPFHQEKTPSFSVDPQQQLFYCFGCHTGGTVYTFLMEHDGLSFNEAVDMLATEVGIPRPQKSENTEVTRHFSRLQAVMEWTQEFFQISANQYAEIFLGYLASRQVSEAARKRFELGYAPKSWNALTQFLSKHGITDAEMLEAGVAVSRQENQGIYDRWRHRIMFPIWNHRGQLIAFGGRSIEPDQEPKYLNSPDTPLFHKSTVLYGEHLARKFWRQGRRPLLVEGYFDVIACHEAGLGQAVASLGTALSKEHARALARYSKEVDLLYDRDQAGQEAMRRAFMILSEEGVQVNRVTLTSGKDPDEFLREKGLSALAESVERRIPYFEAILEERLADSPRQSARAKAELVEGLKPFWNALSNPIEKAGYLELMARKLQVDQSILAQSFGLKQGNGHISPKNRHNMERIVSKVKRPSYDVYLLALLVRHPEYVGKVRETLPEWILEHDLTPVLDNLEQGRPLAELTSQIDRMETQVRRLVLEALAYDGPDGGPRVFEDVMQAIVRQRDNTRWKSLIARLKQGEDSPELIREIQALQSRLAQDQMTRTSAPWDAVRIGKEG